MFFKVISALALLGCSFLASASQYTHTYNLDPVNSQQLVSYTTPGLSFDDLFTFTIPVNSLGAAAAIKFDLSIGSIQACAIPNLIVTAA